VAMKNLAADFGKKNGMTVAVVPTNPANFMKDMTGAQFDVVAAAAVTLAELNEADQLQAASRKPLARTGIGVAVKEGAAKPELSTVTAFKKAVTEAKSFVYSDPATPNGSGVIVQHILTNAGLSEAMKTKGHLAGLGPGREGIAKGEYDMGLFNISEALAPGVVLAGPVPAPLQQYTDYDVAILKSAPAQKEAAAFARYISAKAQSRIWTDAGLEQAAPH
jgi:molybdate transport system substrate-binding protein